MEFEVCIIESNITYAWKDFPSGKKIVTLGIASVNFQ